MQDGRCSFSIGGTRLSCRVIGQGSPVLLLHGYGQSGAIFADLGRYLAKRHQVVLLDSRGHGRSGTGANPLSISLMAADTVAVLGRLGISCADVIGFSDGGNIALQMAVQYPQYLHSVTVISGNARPAGLRRSYLALIRFWRELLNLASFAHLLPRSWYQMTDLLLYQPRLSNEDLRHISAPVLLIRGSHDLVQASHLTELARVIPKARTLTINGTGHASIISHWRTYIRHIELLLR